MTDENNFKFRMKFLRGHRYDRKDVHVSFRERQDRFVLTGCRAVHNLAIRKLYFKDIVMF